MSALLVALVVLPLVSAAVVGYFRNTWSKTLVSWVACGSVAATFVSTLLLLFTFLGNHEPIHAQLTNMGPALSVFGLVADSLSLWWMVVVTGCGFLIHLYSTAYMHDDPSFGRFMAKLNYFIFAMSVLVLADNFMGLLMGWANVGLASYLLIGFYYKKPAAQNAAMKAFVMNSLGEVGLIAGIAFIWIHFGTLKYDEVFSAILAGKELYALNLIGICLLAGAVAKSAQMPLHTWLPYAMEGPTPVSALIHAATMVTAGVYLVSRCWPIYQNAETASALVAWIGGIGALFGAIVAAGQNDIKRVLAFSTLSQIGYMFMANGLHAYVAADFHFLTHAFFKAALFLTAGIVVHHYAGDQDIRKMGGLAKTDKFATWIFGIGAAALIGLPPFAGFWSKDEILAAAWMDNKALFVIAVIAAGMTAFYNVRLFSLVFLGEPYKPVFKSLAKRNASATKKAEHHDAHAAHGAHGHEEHHGTPWQEKWAVTILAVLSVVVGLISLLYWQTDFLQHSFEGLELEHEGLNLVVAGTSVVIALIGMGISWYLYGPNGVKREAELNLNAKPGILLHMFYFDDIYEYLVIKPVTAISGWIADVADAKIVDGIVNGLGTVAASIGSGLKSLQNGHIRRYAIYVFAGLALMLVYFIAYV